MTHLIITNQQELEAAINNNSEFTFEFDGLLYYVEEGCEAYYNYDIYPSGTNVEQAKEDCNDDIVLDGGMWESESVDGLFEFMTSSNEHLKANI